MAWILLDSGEVGSLGADITCVVNTVAADDEVDAAGVGLFGAQGSDDA
jgi:hypothetical protein